MPITVKTNSKIIRTKPLRLNSSINFDNPGKYLIKQPCSNECEFCKKAKETPILVCCWSYATLPMGMAYFEEDYWFNYFYCNNNAVILKQGHPVSSNMVHFIEITLRPNGIELMAIKAKLKV